MDFPEKSSQLSLIARKFCRHHLDCNDVLRFCVARLIDDPVFPPAHEGNERVLSQVKIAATRPQFLSLPRSQPPPQSQLAQNVGETRPVGLQFRQQSKLFVRQQSTLLKSRENSLFRFVLQAIGPPLVQGIRRNVIAFVSATPIRVTPRSTAGTRQDCLLKLPTVAKASFDLIDQHLED